MNALIDGVAGRALLDGVRQRLAQSGAEPTPARVAQALREQGRVLGDAEVLGAAERLRSELVGSGPLEPLLADPSVTDVLVSAPDRVWVDRGGGLEATDVSFPDAAAVRRLAQRLAAVAGRRLDDARPWADARLPDGTRLHAVLPPVAVGCTCLSLRVVRPRAFTLDELVAAGTVPPGGDRILRALLEARVSFLVSGGTGTGNPNICLQRLCADRAERNPDRRQGVPLTCDYVGGFVSLAVSLRIQGGRRKRPRRRRGAPAGAAGSRPPHTARGGGAGGGLLGDWGRPASGVARAGAAGHEEDLPARVRQGDVERSAALVVQVAVVGLPAERALGGQDHRGRGGHDRSPSGTRP